ncbi:hypothetical protein ACFWRG_32850, partial [Micromonospora tulbaghiae]
MTTSGPEAQAYVLITPDEPTWEEKEFISDFEIADPDDAEAFAQAGQALADRHQLTGVATWTEWYLTQTASLARRLGLPTNSPEVMEGARNKAV